MFNERNFNELTKAIDQLPTISIRIDAKDMIGALRAMSCSCTRTCYRKLTKEIAEEAKKENMLVCVGQYFCMNCGNERQ